MKRSFLKILQYVIVVLIIGILFLFSYYSVQYDRDLYKRKYSGTTELDYVWERVTRQNGAK